MFVNILFFGATLGIVVRTANAVPLIPDAVAHLHLHHIVDRQSPTSESDVTKVDTFECAISCDSDTGTCTTKPCGDGQCYAVSTEPGFNGLKVSHYSNLERRNTISCSLQFGGCYSGYYDGSNRCPLDGCGIESSEEIDQYTVCCCSGHLCNVAAMSVSNVNSNATAEVEVEST